MTLWMFVRRMACGLAMAVFSLVPAHAEPIAKPELDDAALAAVAGRGMLQLSNSNYGGLDFTRVTLGADLSLSANFSNVRLGEYTYAARNGTGADIDIPLLRFGRSDLTDTERLVSISDPYLEFVYRGSGATRELIGARLGFNGIAGHVGLQASTVSGSLFINGGAAGNVDSSTDPLGGKRWDGSCSTSPCLPLSSVGGVIAGDANGPSRDFWVALLKAPVQFPAANGLPAPAVAQPGVWMNWTDRLQAIQINLPPPPNAPK